MEKPSRSRLIEPYVLVRVHLVFVIVALCEVLNEISVRDYYLSHYPEGSVRLVELTPDLLRHDSVMPVEGVCMLTVSWEIYICFVDSVDTDTEGKSP